MYFILKSSGKITKTSLKIVHLILRKWFYILCSYAFACRAALVPSNCSFYTAIDYTYTTQILVISISFSFYFTSMWVFNTLQKKNLFLSSLLYTLTLTHHPIVKEGKKNTN